MKLYKIRGTSEWVPWSVLYNERGYNSVPCIDMAFKSISPWGTSAGTGYRTNGAGNVTYFVSGETGWYLAYNLPGALGVYPDEATPIQMIKDGVVSDAVWMEFFGSKWYLIQAEIANERYWIHELALPEYGWEIYEGKDYEFILVDGTTGRIVHGVEQLNEMVFAPTGYFTIEDTGDIVFVDQSPYPIVSRFHVDFDTVQTLADGAYIDTVLPYYTSKLYIAGIMDRVAETVVDFGLTVSNEVGYVRVTNNTGASVTLTRLAIQSMDATGAEVVEVVDGQDNHAYAFKWDDGGTPCCLLYWWISYSGERHWTDALGNWSEVPSVVLPTVTALASIGQDTASIASQGNTYALKTWDAGGWYGTYIPVDATKIYAIHEYADGNGGYKSPVGTFETTSVGGNLGAKNVSSSSQNFRSMKSYSCSDPTAIVVPVYNSSNVAYNAFKFTASGTDYYYVLDGTQTDWTDDLSSIGYTEDSPEPPVSLPTVTEITIYSNSSDHYFQFNVTNQTTLITSMYTYDLYLDQACTNPFVYDSSSLYLLGYLSSGTWKKSSVQTVADMPSSTTSDISSSISAQVLTSSGKLWLITNYTGTLHDGGYQWSKVCKVCSSNQATVITVYNSSNVAYNAFKFTASGTDYYYVLDGTQTDWTDDLASIGYILTFEA